MLSSSSSRSLDDDLVGGGVDVLEVVLLVKWIFVLYFGVEVLYRLFTGILRRLRSRSLSRWSLWRCLEMV